MKGRVPILVITWQNGTLTILYWFHQFWQHLSCDFERKLFLSGGTVSVNRRRKDIKVASVSFDLHAGRFIEECTHAIFIFWHFYIRFMGFGFGFEDYRVFTVSHKLAYSHLIYYTLFGLVSRKLRKRIWIRVLSQIHATPIFLFLSS